MLKSFQQKKVSSQLLLNGKKLKQTEKVTSQRKKVTSRLLLNKKGLKTNGKNYFSIFV